MKLLNLCLAMIDEEADKQKFEQMYEQYKNLLLHCAKKRLDDVHLAEDAVSIAFLHIAENMHLVKEAISDHTKRLLVTMVDRAAINIYKKEQRIQNKNISIDEVAHMIHEPKLDQVYIVAEAIEKLPKLYQDILTLRYADGYTNREIAAIMDFTVSKVDKMMSRARKQLAILLEEVQEV